MCGLTLARPPAAGTQRGLVRCLRRPSKCQKRPTIGAKETYYVRTFESLPIHSYALVVRKRCGNFRNFSICLTNQCQKRPTTASKETYYSVKRDLLCADFSICFNTRVSKETYYRGKRGLGPQALRKLRKILKLFYLFRCGPIHICICMCVCVCVCVFVCVCVETFRSAPVWLNWDGYIYVCMYMYVCMLVCICMYVFVCMYVYVCMYIYIYINIY